MIDREKERVFLFDYIWLHYIIRLGYKQLFIYMVLYDPFASKILDSIQNYQLILPPPPYPNPEVYKDSKSLEKLIHCYQNILSPSFILSLSLCSLLEFGFFLFLLTNIYRSI